MRQVSLSLRPIRICSTDAAPSLLHFAVVRQHPLWDQYNFADGTPFWVNPFSLRATLKFPEAVRSCRGGILADEMGMGKTIETLALIVHNHPILGATRAPSSSGPMYYASDDDELPPEGSPEDSPSSSPVRVRWRRRPWSARKPEPTGTSAAFPPVRKSRRLQERQENRGPPPRIIDPFSDKDKDAPTDPISSDSGSETDSGSRGMNRVDCVSSGQAEDQPPKDPEPLLDRDHSFPVTITPDLQPIPSALQRSVMWTQPGGAFPRLRKYFKGSLLERAPSCRIKGLLGSPRAVVGCVIALHHPTRSYLGLS